MKFNRIYKLLNEAFKQYKYKLPKDKEEQLYDFYMLTGLQVPSDINLKTAYEDAKETVLKSLKTELLKAVEFAVSAEIRHMFDWNSIKPLREFFERHNAKDFLKAYSSKYRIPFKKIGLTDSDRSQIVKEFKDNQKGYVKSYNALLYALNKTGLSMEDFMKIASKAFVEVNWERDYGGNAWQQVAEGWLMLDNASQQSDLITSIDHIYDLQHNTDTIFDKLQSYYKGGFEWIKKALDKKFEVKELHELYDDISLGLRPFAAAVIKDTTGQTLEDFIRNRAKKLGKDAETLGEEAFKFLKDNNIKKYKINKDGSIDINQDVDFEELKELPININKINGNLEGWFGSLKTLKGFPKEINGWAEITGTPKIKNLKHLKGLKVKEDLWLSKKFKKDSIIKTIKARNIKFV